MSNGQEYLILDRPLNLAVEMTPGTKQKRFNYGTDH